jgi:hypothetical protein
MSNIEIYDGGYSDEQRELDQAAFVASAQAQADAQAVQATAKQAVLDRLGISDAEAKLLLS